MSRFGFSGSTDLDALIATTESEIASLNAKLAAMIIPPMAGREAAIRQKAETEKKAVAVKRTLADLKLKREREKTDVKEYEAWKKLQPAVAKKVSRNEKAEAVRRAFNFLKKGGRHTKHKRRSRSRTRKH